MTHPLSESFDGAQDERRSFDIFEDFPFMLRLLKHSECFFSNLLVPSRFRNCENVKLSVWNVVATGETRVCSHIPSLSVRAAQVLSAAVLCVLVPFAVPVADVVVAVVFAAVVPGVVLALVVAGVVEHAPVPVAALERCDLALFVVCAQDPVVVAAHALGALAPAVVLTARGEPAPVAAAPVLCALAPARGAQVLAVFAAAPDVLAVVVV